MIRRAAPRRFDGVAESGRNRPLIITVETTDGVEHEAYLKASARPDLGTEGLANEAIAACLAGDLGLPIMEPYLVDLDPNWVAAITDQTTRAMLERSAPVAFASKSAGNQWSIWSRADRVDVARKDAALRILAFDAFIENDDRRGDKPNCLVRAHEFRIIDHELAFRIRLKRFPPPEPWRAGYQDRLTGPNGHIFGAKLKGQELQFDTVRGAWSDLPNARLDEYLRALPPEWRDAMDASRDAIGQVKAVRDRIDECVAELQRALT